MTLSHATLHWHDATYPNNAEYGPLNIPQNAYVTEVKVTGQITAQLQQDTFSGFPSGLNYYQGLLGIERLPHGASPINLEGGGDASSEIIALEAVKIQAGAQYLVPSSGINGVWTWVAHEVDLRWRGCFQAAPSGGLDFYAAIGRITGSQPTFLYAGCLDIWYNT